MTQLHVLAIELQKLAQDEDIPADALKDTIEAITASVEEKAQALVKMTLNFDSDIAQLDAEIDRIKARKQAIANRKESLIDYLRENMERLDIKKISCPLFSITHVDGQDIVVIDDESVIPDDYVKVKTEISPDKNLIKKSLKDGLEVAGCRLAKGKSSIRIK